MLETRWGTCLILLAKADHSGCWDSESVDGSIVGGDALPKFLFRRCSISYHISCMKIQEYLRTFGSVSHVGDHGMHHAGGYSVTTSDKAEDTRKQDPADWSEPPVTHSHDPSKGIKNCSATKN
ncbi:hypothetical protein BFJ70_g1955 [Fusarium oxysporum]|nr:hypothetical protein BFJ70_g1955 [Fusarium oxysporum]